MIDLYEEPHRRFNPLTGEWILVSAGRTQRPWVGQTSPAHDNERPRYHPDCYLCPGNLRAGGVRNPEYDSTFVFTNDFASLRPDTALTSTDARNLLIAETEAGTSRVVCFSPRHDLTLGAMSETELRAVVDLWADQSAELAQGYRWVQVFENRGELMGASNPHPHGQIWAGSALPSVPAAEDRHQRSYFANRGSPLLADYVEIERELEDRTVAVNADWMAIVPFWATWPFETLLIPRRRVTRIHDLDRQARLHLTSALHELLVRYDRLFDRVFPYSMGWHGAPNGADDVDDHWLLHAHFYPPLMGPDRRKFMVGYEMLSESQRDFSPEEATQRLREA